MATVVALQEWLNMDHEERIAGQERRGQIISQATGGIAHVAVEWVTEERAISNSVNLTIDEAALGKTAAQISQALQEGTTSIWVGRKDNTLHVTVSELTEEEAKIVAERLRAVLLN